MKKHAIAILITAGTLLVTSCSAQPSASPAPASGTPSVASPATPSVSAATPETAAPTQGSGSSLPEVPMTGAPIAANATGKPGVATDEQMAVIDKVARALSNGKYEDAAAAGYYVFDKHGALSQDVTIMASKRAQHADYFDAVKAAYAKGGCQLVPVKINSSGTIYTNMTCNDGSAPTVSVHASFMNGNLAYIDALYVE